MISWNRSSRPRGLETTFIKLVSHEPRGRSAIGYRPPAGRSQPESRTFSMHCVRRRGKSAMGPPVQRSSSGDDSPRSSMSD
jgi:hypothetical protein